MSASQARGPGVQVSVGALLFLIEVSGLCTRVAPRVAFSGMGQARIENNLLIYLFRSIIYLNTLNTEQSLPEEFINLHYRIRLCGQEGQFIQYTSYKS